MYLIKGALQEEVESDWRISPPPPSPQPQPPPNVSSKGWLSTPGWWEGAWDNKTLSLSLTFIFSLKCVKQVKLWGHQRGSHRISPLAGELVLSGVRHPGLVSVGRGGRRDEVASETRSVGSWDGEHCRHRITWHGGDGWVRLSQRLAHWADICTSSGKLGNRILALGKELLGGGCGGQQISTCNLSPCSPAQRVVESPAETRTWLSREVMAQLPLPSLPNSPIPIPHRWSAGERKWHLGARGFPPRRMGVFKEPRRGTKRNGFHW